MAQTVHAARMCDEILHPSLAAELISAVAEAVIYAAATAAVAAAISLAVVGTVATGGAAGIAIAAVAGVAVGAMSTLRLAKTKLSAMPFPAFATILATAWMPPSPTERLQAAQPMSSSTTSPPLAQPALLGHLQEQRPMQSKSNLPFWRTLVRWPWLPRPSFSR